MRLDWLLIRKRQRRYQGNHLLLLCESRVCSEDVCTCAPNCDLPTRRHQNFDISIGFSDFWGCRDATRRRNIFEKKSKHEADRKRM
ncbi:hypothetical protein AVEN_149237-1 [Araneus ventricosus]|uniref:Uncharacterized protein n=1 Tax=Araneus ventricosus TaxID=182803 RepID=A0A4Y2X432_ARAVE|nr:hypothetical protein AVEN_149237-1 [Araneus ventricosus]